MMSGDSKDDVPVAIGAWTSVKNLLFQKQMVNLVDVASVGLPAGSCAKNVPCTMVVEFQLDKDRVLVRRLLLPQPSSSWSYALVADTIHSSMQKDMELHCANEYKEYGFEVGPITVDPMACPTSVIFDPRMLVGKEPQELDDFSLQALLAAFRAENAEPRLVATRYVPRTRQSSGSALLDALNGHETDDVKKLLLRRWTTRDRRAVGFGAKLHAVHVAAQNEDTKTLATLLQNETVYDATAENMLNLENPKGCRALCFVSSVPSSNRECHKWILARGGTLCSKCVTKQLESLHTTDSRVFTFNRASAFQALYLPKSDGQQEMEIKRSARELVSLINTIQGGATIRYRKGSSLCEAIAREVDSEILLWSANHKQPFSSGKQPGTILCITDRASDPVTPLMREFSYEAIIHELDGNLQIPTHSKLMSELDDPFWAQHRHSHLGIALSEAVKPGPSTDSTTPQVSLSTVAIKPAHVDIANVLRELAMGRQKAGLQTLHVEMLTRCGEAIKQLQYLSIASLEQDLATGVDEDGDVIEPQVLTSAFATAAIDPTFTSAQKLRMLLLYYCTQGPLKESDRSQFVSGIDLRLQNALLNVEKLGVSLTDVKKAKQETAARLAEFQSASVAEQLKGMRYTPRLRNMLKQLVTGRLSIDQYPILTTVDPKTYKGVAAAVINGQTIHSFLKMPVDAKMASPVDAKLKEAQSTNPIAQQRFIVFMAGGVTYSEIREVHNVAKETGAGLIIGSQHMITAHQMIADLAEMPASLISFSKAKD